MQIKARAKWVIAGYRLFFAALIVVAITTQLINRLGHGFNAVNFFSYFTIESNILAAIVLAVGAFVLLSGTKRTQAMTVIRGAATVFMATTGIVYILLLSGDERALQVTIPWVNLVLHYIIPIVMFLDWAVVPPAFKISFRQMLAWLIFPFAYVIYTLVRGPIVNWYPYPFLDPRPDGYGKVAVTSCFIAVGVLVICLIVRAVGNYQVRKR